MERFQAWFAKHQAKLWVAGLLAIVVLGVIAAAPGPAPARWEYEMVQFLVGQSGEIPKGKAAMNKLGAAGWRYAGMIRTKYDRAFVVLERRR